MRSIISKTLTFATFALVLGVFSFTADAQTTRKPKATPTPIPMGGAEIISQSSDYDKPPVVKPLMSPSDAAPADKSAARIKELTDRIAKLEATPKSDYDEKQKRMLLNLDILTKAEQRSETLRKQLFEMVEKESTVRSRLDQIENDSRPEMIERTLQLAGSMKPEEVREFRRKSLIAEKTNLQNLLVEIQSTKANLASTLDKSDAMVEKLRTKLEKDIDETFLKDPE